jgi:hypothetical protein
VRGKNVAENTFLSPELMDKFKDLKDQVKRFGGLLRQRTPDVSRPLSRNPQQDAMSNVPVAASISNDVPPLILHGTRPMD